MSICDFAYEEVKFDLELERMGYTSIRRFYPSRKTSFCCADKENSYVIDSDGHLYSCWADFGNKDISKGNITDFLSKEHVKKPIDLNYIAYDATNDIKCVQCNILPLCMGGCHKNRIYDDVDRCIDTKYIIEQKLKRTAVRINRAN